MGGAHFECLEHAGLGQSEALSDQMGQLVTMLIVALHGVRIYTGMTHTQQQQQWELLSVSHPRIPHPWLHSPDEVIMITTPIEHRLRPV